MEQTFWNWQKTLFLVLKCVKTCLGNFQRDNMTEYMDGRVDILFVACNLLDWMCMCTVLCIYDIIYTQETGGGGWEGKSRKGRHVASPHLWNHGCAPEFTAETLRGRNLYSHAICPCIIAHAPILYWRLYREQGCYSRTLVARTIRHRSYDRCRSYDTTYSRKQS